MKVIICPDVHCRDFWKPILNINDQPIIFLGDYLDPYKYEGFTDQHGIENFKQIIDFAKNNKNVTLLIGNHDISWIFGRYGCERTNLLLWDELHKIYTDNINLFKPFYVIDNTLFIHGGISNGWIDEINYTQKSINSDFRLNKDNVLSYIDSEWLKEINSYDHCDRWCGYSFNSPIFQIGYCRGGDASYGGPFWHDYRYEYLDPKLDLYQIVGHCQQKETGSIVKVQNLICCDSRVIFEYDTETKEIFKKSFL